MNSIINVFRNFDLSLMTTWREKEMCFSLSLILIQRKIPQSPAIVL